MFIFMTHIYRDGNTFANSLPNIDLTLYSLVWISFPLDGTK